LGVGERATDVAQGAAGLSAFLKHHGGSFFGIELARGGAWLGIGSTRLENILAVVVMTSVLLEQKWRGSERRTA